MSVLVIQGDARHLPLPDRCVDLVVTSPPYFGLRSYTDGGQHYDGQIGSEATPAAYVAVLVACTREWVRVLKPSGSIFVNLGDKYAGSQQQSHGRQSTISSADYWQWSKAQGQPKSLLGLPWRYALACIDQLGLILRAEIVWAKPNGLPESVTDRVRRAHEQVFHFTVRPRYYSAVDEIREPTTFYRGARPLSLYDRTTALKVPGNTPMSGTALEPNPLGKLPGSVWSIPSQPLTVPPALGVDHFAAFPMELPRRLILGWSPAGVCTGCGEGRRPIAAGGRKGDGSKPHKAALRVASFDWAAWKESEPYRITGYACACTDVPGPDERSEGRPATVNRDSRHDAGPGTRPAVVLDPFGGTGTTALLAHVNGRNAVTVDRSADYCRIAAWRTRDPGERARAMQVDKPPPVSPGQDALFTLAELAP